MAIAVETFLSGGRFGPEGAHKLFDNANPPLSINHFTLILLLR